VPEYAIWKLVDRCARRAGSEHFGWKTGLETPIDDIGSFGQRVGAAPTLEAALDLFLHAVAEHSSHARFSVVRGQSGSFFCRHGIDDIEVGAWQIPVSLLRAPSSSIMQPISVGLLIAPLASPVFRLTITWGMPVGES